MRAREVGTSCTSKVVQMASLIIIEHYNHYQYIGIRCTELRIMINSYVFMMFFIMKSVVKLLVFFVETAILILLP